METAVSLEAFTHSEPLTLGEGLGKNRRLHVTVWPDAAEQLDHAAGFQVLRMNFIDHRANG